MEPVSERREKRRFVLTHTIHFRLSAKRPTSRWAAGTIQDMSSSGVSFRCRRPLPLGGHLELIVDWPAPIDDQRLVDRKSTRLNSSHLGISYAVFCLKKKNSA